MKLCEIVLAFHQRPMAMTMGCGTITTAAACAIESPTNAACSTPARETDREVVTAAYAMAGRRARGYWPLTERILVTISWTSGAKRPVPTFVTPRCSGYASGDVGFSIAGRRRPTGR